MIASFSFASTPHVTQWSNNLTQRTEILTRRSNLTPQGAQNTVNDLSGACGTEVALDILKQAKAAKDQQAAIGSLLRMEIILPNDLMKKDLIDILAPPFANRQNCSHNRAAKHIKISFLH